MRDVVCMEMLETLQDAFRLDGRGLLGCFASTGLPRLNPLVKGDGGLVLLRDLEGVS